MASHGSVLDLLDDRYLNLQDVTGNVEPFPTLVPYEQYTQTMVVYRMDHKHEFFIGLLHEFTDRTARQTAGNELWTWFVQWEVEARSESPSAPAAKRPRLDSPLGLPADKSLPQKGPAYTICERRCLRAALFQEPDMLRILIDIVQVDSRLVPNYVEFLYQWIDYYEGDGKALKAAVRMEIPSLWLFEYHPLPIFGKKPGPVVGDVKMGEKDDFHEVAENIGERFTRKKPDVAAFERRTEESERLQYREPKFGLQPPLDPKDEPLSPLINEPRDPAKRRKYYAACFKNRQRAFWLLQEAGLSARQVANYKRLQEMGPKDTPEDINGTGFVNYYKDEPYAHEQFMVIEKMQKLREKQNEIAISNRLALEAQLAAAAQPGSIPGEAFSSQRSVPPPLIPPTPTYPGRPDVVMPILERMRAMAKKGDPPIRTLPAPVHKRIKSKLFANAAVARPAKMVMVHPSQIPNWPWEDDSESEYESESEVYSGDDIDPDERDDSDDEFDEDDGEPMDVTTNDRPTAIAPQVQFPTTQPPAPTAPNIAAFVQGLNRAQLGTLMPLLNIQAQQAVLQRAAALSTAPQPQLQPPSQAPAFDMGPQFVANLPTGASSQIAQPPLPMQPSLAAGPQMPRLGPPPGPPAITLTPAASVPGTHGQTAQNAAELDAQSQETLRSLRFQQFMAAQGIPTQAQTVPVSFAAQGNSVPSPMPTQEVSSSLQPTPVSLGVAQGTGVVPSGPSLGVPVPPQVTSSPLGEPSGIGAFPPRPTQLLTQSSTRAMPPASLDLQRPTLNSGLPTPPPSLMTPLADLAGSLSLASPQAASPYGIPIQIYIPKIVLRPNTTLANATDCLILGHTQPGTGVLALSKAIFLSVGVWENTLRRVRLGKFTALESYSAPPNHPRFVARKGTLNNPDEIRGPHKVLHDKINQIYGFMANCIDREEELTKRYRATQGPITETKRGAVWEGWGVYVDSAIEMRAEDRKGAMVTSSVDRKIRKSEEDEEERRRLKEIDDLLDEESDVAGHDMYDKMEE